MKRAMLVSGILSVLACGSAYGQVGQPFPGPDARPPEIPPAFDTLQMQGRYFAVREFMRQPSPLSPVGDLTLGMMGDEVAVYLDKILGDSPRLPAARMLTVLDIIHNSFKMPASIQHCIDRNPEKSLALLKTLQETAVDQVIRERIATETAFLNNFLSETMTPVPLANLPCNPRGMSEDVDLSMPANDLPPDAIVDSPMATSGPAPPPAVRARFATVSAYMRFPSPLQLGDRYLAAMGDEAAFFVYSFMGNSPPLTTAQMLTALDIIHKSFASPMAIQGGAARRPEKSLALLKMLQKTAVDQTVKERIATETNFLNDVPKKIYAPWRGIPDPPIRLVRTP